MVVNLCTHLSLLLVPSFPAFSLYSSKSIPTDSTLLAKPFPSVSSSSTFSLRNLLDAMSLLFQTQKETFFPDCFSESAHNLWNRLQNFLVFPPARGSLCRPRTPSNAIADKPSQLLPLRLASPCTEYLKSTLQEPKVVFCPVPDDLALNFPKCCGRVDNQQNCSFCPSLPHWNCIYPSLEVLHRPFFLLLRCFLL